MSALSPIPPVSAPLVRVSAAEAGMKLLRFLERRLGGGQPKSVLHKWLRTGQVRVNGSRAKAFDLLAEGDAVRLPPFALGQLRQGNDAPAKEPSGEQPLVGPDAGANPGTNLGKGLQLVDRQGDCLVLLKAGGLPSQGGSGHDDSVAHRLARAFDGANFIPAPAHRLDKDTSGLMLAGASHAAQQSLHRLFARNGIAKYYLAWVRGHMPVKGPFALVDTLSLGREATGRELVQALPGGSCLPVDDARLQTLCAGGPAQSPGLALTLAVFVPLPAQRASGPPEAQANLLLLRPLTGRKHQLRVQLAARGLPILGDKRYGLAPDKVLPRLYLHAWCLRLPHIEPCGRVIPGRECLFAAPPPWEAPFSPPPETLQKAREGLDLAAGALFADDSP